MILLAIKRKNANTVCTYTLFDFTNVPLHWLKQLSLHKKQSFSLGEAIHTNSDTRNVKMTFLCWTQKRQNNFPWISLKIWVISSKGTHYFQLNSQLLATNKSKKKNFSLHNVNNKHFKANSSDGEDNSEHFKTNSSHGENPLIAHSTAAWALSYLCKAYLVNSLLTSGKEVKQF